MNVAPVSPVAVRLIAAPRHTIPPLDSVPSGIAILTTFLVTITPPLQKSEPILRLK